MNFFFQCRGIIFFIVFNSPRSENTNLIQKASFGTYGSVIPTLREQQKVTNFHDVVARFSQKIEGTFSSTGNFNRKPSTCERVSI